MGTVEPNVTVRCPMHPRRVFAKLSMGEARVDRDDNTIEFACRDCREQIGRQRGGRKPKTVLHTFTLFGELIETYVEG